MPVTIGPSPLEQLADLLFETIKGIADRLAARIAALETLNVAKRLELLEQRPTLVYRGVWKAGDAYHPGDNVTYAGSLWVCLAPTAERPGEANSAEKSWQLAVKRGADGRDRSL